jgi:hypothetical protein
MTPNSVVTRGPLLKLLILNLKLINVPCMHPVYLIMPLGNTKKKFLKLKCMILLF